MVLTPQKVAALATLSNETVADSDSNVLDSVGQKMVRSVALAADKAMFNGTYAGIVTAAGIVRAAGGVPNAAFVNPAT
jgi:HK97 family phage major capsid protein